MVAPRHLNELDLFLDKNTHHNHSERLDAVESLHEWIGNVDELSERLDWIFENYRSYATALSHWGSNGCDVGQTVDSWPSEWGQPPNKSALRRTHKEGGSSQVVRSLTKKSPPADEPMARLTLVAQAMKIANLRGSGAGARLEEHKDPQILPIMYMTFSDFVQRPSRNTNGLRNTLCRDSQPALLIRFSDDARSDGEVLHDTCREIMHGACIWQPVVLNNDSLVLKAVDSDDVSDVIESWNRFAQSALQVLTCINENIDRIS